MSVTPIQHPRADDEYRTQDVVQLTRCRFTVLQLSFIVPACCTLHVASWYILIPCIWDTLFQVSRAKSSDASRKTWLRVLPSQQPVSSLGKAAGLLQPITAAKCADWRFVVRPERHVFDVFVTFTMSYWRCYYVLDIATTTLLWLRYYYSTYYSHSTTVYVTCSLFFQFAFRKPLWTQYGLTCRFCAWLVKLLSCKTAL